jgi:hypothetical protein
MHTARWNIAWIIDKTCQKMPKTEEKTHHREIISSYQSCKGISKINFSRLNNTNKYWFGIKLQIMI